MLDLSTLLEPISAMSPVAVAVVAAAGLTMGMAPSSLPLFSIVVGYVAGQAGDDELKGRTRGLYLSLGFVLGMATVDAAIGALFGFLGYVVIQALASYLVVTNLVLAALLVLLGLVLLTSVSELWPRPHRSATRRRCWVEPRRDYGTREDRRVPSSRERKRTPCGSTSGACCPGSVPSPRNELDVALLVCVRSLAVPDARARRAWQSLPIPCSAEHGISER